MYLDMTYCINLFFPLLIPPFLHPSIPLFFPPSLLPFLLPSFPPSLPCIIHSFLSFFHIAVVVKNIILKSDKTGLKT